MRFTEAYDNVLRTHSDRIAFIDETQSPPRSYTFAEAGAEIEELQEFLETNIPAHGRIAILVPRSFAAVRTIMASVRARRCYIPLHADLAHERLRAALIDTEPTLIALHASQIESLKALFTDLGYSEIVSENEIRFYHRDIHEPPAEIEHGIILHTSGSTGMPKAILHSRAAFMSCVFWVLETFRPGPDDKVLSTIPYHFDPSIFDIFSTFLGGAEFVIPSDSLLEDPGAFCEYLARREISVVNSVPTFLRFVQGYGSPDRFEYRKLKHIYVGGEIFDVECARTLQRQFRHSRLFNFCGPAEIICASYYPIPDDFFAIPRKTIPIGSTFGVGEYRITDEGEMLVTGEQLMLGYWKRPDLTEQKIVEWDGRRWYRTGDIVHREGDGPLEYVGRRDRMIKRKAVRIELDDIQRNLTNRPGIHEVAVTARPDPLQGSRIIAHVVWADPAPPSAVELKRRSKEWLPHDMIPDRFEFHPKLPLTSTGKIDYQKLM